MTQVGFSPRISLKSRSLSLVSENILTTYSFEPGNDSPCHVMDWNLGGGKEDASGDRGGCAEVKIVLGMVDPEGKPKNEGAGCFWVVVRYVTCNLTYGVGLPSSAHSLKNAETTHGTGSINSFSKLFIPCSPHGAAQNT